MTTIIAPNGDAVGSTFVKPEEYASEARRRGWVATVAGDRVYIHPGFKLAAHIEAAEREAGLR